jgi:hypothetical protein
LLHSPQANNKSHSGIETPLRDSTVLQPASESQSPNQ